MISLTKVPCNASKFSFRTMLTNPFPELIEAHLTSDLLSDLTDIYSKLTRYVDFELKPIYQFFCPITHSLYYQFSFIGDINYVESVLKYFFNIIPDDYLEEIHTVYDFNVTYTNLGFSLELYSSNSNYDGFISQMTKCLGERSGEILKFKHLNYLQIINLMNSLYRCQFLAKSTLDLCIKTLEEECNKHLKYTIC